MAGGKKNKIVINKADFKKNPALDLTGLVLHGLHHNVGLRSIGVPKKVCSGPKKEIFCDGISENISLCLQRFFMHDV